VKIAAAVLTFQAVTHDRVDLLLDTLDSLDEADELLVVDNGSTDGSQDLVHDLGGYVNDAPLTTSGHGTNLQARLLAATDADICVLSDDDMHWRPGWSDRLRSWWADAPDDVALTGCHIEPLFPWNKVHGTITRGGIPALVRASTGAASWSYRARHYDDIFGPAGIPQQVQGHGDVPACDRIHDRGFRICQIDLADHRGHERSTWGNRTIERYGWDVQPAIDLLKVAA
jgi:glycosyltransferase involved in cell wall biosynthesis